MELGHDCGEVCPDGSMELLGFPELGLDTGAYCVEVGGLVRLGRARIGGLGRVC